MVMLSKIPWLCVAVCVCVATQQYAANGIRALLQDTTGGVRRTLNLHVLQIKSTCSEGLHRPLLAAAFVQEL